MVSSSNRRKKMQKKKAGKDPMNKSPAPILDKAVGAMRCVIDPHTNISVYDMGLIELKTKKNAILATFRPTSPFCPLCTQLALNIKRNLKNVDGVKGVSVTVVGHYQEDNINNVLRKEEEWDSEVAAADPPPRKRIPEKKTKK